MNTLALDLPPVLPLRKRAARIVAAPTESASAAIGKLEPGARLFGFTKGQFSLLDLIRAVLARTGPAHVTVSTWTTGIRDAENAGFLIERGDLLSFRLLTDRSFPTRQPEYCRRVTEIFGREAIRCTRTHAKFALIRNDRWSIAIRSSMNLNRNPRFEQFDLDDDAPLCDFMEAHVAEMVAAMPPGTDAGTPACDRAFAAALGGGLSDVYSLDTPDDTSVDMAEALREIDRIPAV